MEKPTDEQPQGNLPGIPMGGPYLALAILCEKVLNENGVLSLIRVVDRIIVSASGPESPAEMPPAPVNLTLVVGFKSGFARGPYEVRIKTISPSHQEMSVVELPMLFEGEDRGSQVALNVAFQAIEAGVFWFDVYVLDVLVTRVPLRVMYQRVSMS